MITGEPAEFTMSQDASMRIAPGVGALASSSDPPESLHAAAFSIEIKINHDWKPMRVLGVRWDDGIQMFLIHVAYVNSTGSPQLCDGQIRALFGGRVVLEFPSANAQAILLPAGLEIRTACAFKM